MEATEPKPCKIRLMAAGHGDKVLATYNPLIETEARSARDVWDSEVVGRGRFAFSVEGEGNNRLLREFEPVADMMIVPMITGG